MAKRSLSDQLNDAVEASMTNPDAPSATDAKLAALLRIAADLRELPSREFKARLAADLRELSTPPATPRAVPPGYHTATACLVARDAAQAIAFYQKAFAARELVRHVGPDGKILHAEIQVGDSRIALAEEMPEYGNLSPQSLGGSPVVMSLYVDDVDALASRAVAAGARMIFPVADQFYGDRSGRLADPFGHVWIVATHKEDVAAEEMQRRMAAFGAPPEAPATTPSPQPARQRPNLMPYLQVNGAAGLIEFLQQAFGGRELRREAQPDGRIAHAEVQVEDSIIELADASAEFPEAPCAIHLYVTDVDTAYQRALAAGASSVQAPTIQPYGDREAGIKDSFGNRWYIATHLEGPKDAPSSHVPEGLRSVTPYLHPHGAQGLIEFLTTAFGAEEALRVNAPDGSVVHAKIRLGDSMVEMGEAQGEYQPLSTALHLYVADTDTAYARALRAGASSLFVPADAPYGDRVAGIADPFGNRWYIATPLAQAPAAAPAAKHETEAAVSTPPVPAGFHTVTPYLVVPNAPQLMAFLESAFGATEVMRSGDPAGHFHGEMRIGNSMVMLGNAGHGTNAYAGMIYLYVADVDAAYAQALRAGAGSVQAPADQPYGDRNAAVTDPFGNAWWIATHKKDMPH